MVAAWLLFPLLTVVISLGCGLLVEWATGSELPGGLLVSLGLAAVIVIVSLLTTYSFAAPHATQVLVIVAVVGLVVRRRRLRAFKLDWFELAACVGVFCVCAAPAVLSGNATFLGYYVLNDGVIHFSLINWVLAHGHALPALQPSAYQALLESYLTTGYPLGADVAIGAIRPLVGQDVAWLFQPFMALVMALGAGALYELLRTVIPSRRMRALAAFVAAQAALLYAYYLEGSIKEVTTTWVITLTVVLVFDTLGRRLRVRALIPLALVTVAGYYVLNFAIAPWLAPPLAAFVVAVVWRSRGAIRAAPRRRLIGWTAAGLAVVVVAGAILVNRASTFLTVAQGVLTNPHDLGNLAGPLSKLEMSGIWPVGDFRFQITEHHRIAYTLIAVAVISGVLGTAWAIWRRRLAPLLLLAGNAIAAAYLLSRASPYASGKVMMIVSLTAVTTAMLGPAALADAGRRVLAWGLLAAIAGGVLWSNALGYHDASIAPRDRLAELSSIDRQFRGQGPAFYNLSDEYATYFLRDLAPTDPAIGAPAARTPAATPIGRNPWDPDDLPLTTIESYKLIVIGNPALVSRPPANFELAYRGRFFDVWRRTATPTVLLHIPLGKGLYRPASVPSCRLVRATAAQARRQHDMLAYVVRPVLPALIPAKASHPGEWGGVGGDPFSLIPRQEPGTVSGPVNVPAGGRYTVEVTGALSQRLDALVDGRRVGSIGYELGPPGQTTTVGSVQLTPGRHTVAVVRPSNNLTPGDGGSTRTLGPVLLLHGPAVPPVSVIDPSRAASICGQPLDWLEIVR